MPLSEISYTIEKAEVEGRLVMASHASISIDWGYKTVTNAHESSDPLIDVEVPATKE